MGVPAAETAMSVDAVTPAEEAAVRKSWARRFVSEFFRMRPAWDSINDVQMQALVRGLSAAQLLAIVECLGYTVTPADLD